MIDWKLIEDETARLIWDRNLIRLADYSPFQIYAWGQYNRALGWTPYYFAAEDENGDAAAMCLGLLRRFPLDTGIFWCVGGPIGDIRFWNENLYENICQKTGLKRVYFRFRCDRELQTKDVRQLEKQGWARSSFKMTSARSMELDLTQSEERLYAGLSRGWRRNLKLARQNNFVIKLCSNPDIDELCRIFAEMEALKKLPPLFSREKLENLFRYVKDNLIFYRCEDESGQLLCFRACLVIGNRACDYLAATTEEGRKHRASYVTFWQLFLHCKEQGITSYDLGGIDPLENPGVYSFKKQTGAREMKFIGEWDRADSDWLRLAGNWSIRFKQNAKPVRKSKSSSAARYKLIERLASTFGL